MSTLKREIRDAYREATDSLLDISQSMPRMKTLVGEWSDTLREFLTLADAGEEGALWQLSVAVSRSAASLASLFQTARRRCEAARRALSTLQAESHGPGVRQEAADNLARACAYAARELDNFEELIATAESRFSSEHELLMELALDHDTPAAIRAITQATIRLAQGE